MFNNDNVPEWANFFTNDQYATFLAQVSDYLKTHDLNGTIGDGIVELADSNNRWGLQNIAQICYQADQEEWHELVFAHFDSMQVALVDGEPPASAATPFAEIEHQLAIRLQPEGILESGTAEHIVYRQQLPGTVSMLVIDFPTTITSITWEMVAAWGKSADFLFELAFKNVRTLSTPEISKIETDAGSEIIAFTGSDFFVASHAVLLDQFPDCIGTYGALLGIPHRHSMMAYPIYDMGVLAALSTLLPAIIGMHREGPGSISPYLYWYDGENYHNLPYTIDGNQLNFEPPANFVAMLENLAEAN